MDKLREKVNLATWHFSVIRKNIIKNWELYLSIASSVPFYPLWTSFFNFQLFFADIRHLQPNYSNCVRPKYRLLALFQQYKETISMYLRTIWTQLSSFQTSLSLDRLGSSSCRRYHDILYESRKFNSVGNYNMFFIENKTRIQKYQKEST